MDLRGSDGVGTMQGMPGHDTPQPRRPGDHLGPQRLRHLTWWTTVGVAYGTGAFLLVGILVTERDLPVAAVAAIGVACATMASARLLERRLPTVAAVDDDRPVPVLLAITAVAGAVATVAAAQWSDTVMGALVAGLAAAAVAISVPRRRQGTVLGLGGLGTMAVVAGARHLAIGRVDPSSAANQGLLMLAAGGAMVGAVWFWRLVHRLERARRLEGQLAVADERLRFAGDLHDIQGHHLQVIARTSELAARLVGSDPDAAAAHMATVHDHARTALADTREVVQGYRRTPLRAELRNATRVLDAAGIDGRLRHDAGRLADQLGDPERQLLGLVVREATTNILRHSVATAARVTLDVDEGHASLAIHNDGASGDPRPPGAGLDALERRLHAVGGSLEWSLADGWFSIVATVPSEQVQPT